MGNRFRSYLIVLLAAGAVLAGMKSDSLYISGGARAVRLYSPAASMDSIYSANGVNLNRVAIDSVTSINRVIVATADSLRSTAISADRLYYDGIYGDIHNHDTTSTQSVPTGATYTKLTLFPSMGPASGVTVDTTNDKMTILTPGSYRVGISMSFGGTANVTWNIAAFLGGVEQESVHFARKLGSGGDVGNANASGIIDVVSVPVDLEVRARHDAGGNASITAIYTNLNTNYLGR